MILFYVASFFCILCSFIHLLKHEAWWIRVFDFIHIQLAFLVAITLVAGFALMPHEVPVIAVLIALAGTLVYHLRIILPFTVFYKKQVLPKRIGNKQDSIRVMVSNVYQYNTEYNQTIKLIHTVKPDLVLVVETDSRWENALAVLKKDFPHVISCALENTYGMILYSKLTITDHKICFAIEKDIPSFELTVQLASGRKIDIYTAHPKPPTPTENESSTERDGELLQIAKKVKARNNPTLVMGDLNDVAWSHTTRLFTRVSGLLDPRIGRGMFNTFHAKIPVMRFPLDHVFSSHHFTLGEMKRLPFCNSDHFPIFIELFYEPTEEAKENQTLADTDDAQEANEKINDAKS